MTGRRIVYALALLLAVAFFVLYKQWFSWLLLWGVIWLPVLSLGLSLPAMVTAKASLRHPRQVRVGVPAKTALVVSCRFPQPPVKAVLQLENTLTGERYVGTAGEYVPVERCGLVKVHFKTLKVYDYLGLFSKKIKDETCYEICVTPRPLPAKPAEGGEAESVSRWIPKAGGGFSENHELRPYREGDNLRMIHWKLAAKTGQLIYREPIVPVRSQTMLMLVLSGTPEELERKLGRLSWLSEDLLSRQVSFGILCRTAKGDLSFSVEDLPSWEAALRQILSSSVTEGEWDPSFFGDHRVCVIGGAPDEA